MIDLENAIFTEIYEAVTSEYSDAEVLSVTTFSPSQFPCVCIEEIGNSVRTSTSDSGKLENHANLTYEVNVYTNNASGKKAACKAIFAIVDEKLASLGFTRTMKEPASMDGASKFRLVGRFTGSASESGTIYRR